MLVGFAGTGADEFQLESVGNQHLSDQVAQLVIEFPGVCGGFQSHMVFRL